MGDEWEDNTKRPINKGIPDFTDDLSSKIELKNWATVYEWLHQDIDGVDKALVMRTRSKKVKVFDAEAIPFHLACYFEAPTDILLKMLDIGGVESAKEVDSKFGSNSLTWACTNHVDLEVIEKIVSIDEEVLRAKNNKQNTGLHMACRFNQDFEVVEFLLKMGGIDSLHEENQSQELPIHKAARNQNDINVIKLFLSEEHGDPRTIEYRDHKDRSPVVLACIGNAPSEIVEFLLDAFIKFHNDKPVIKHDNAVELMIWAQHQTDEVKASFLDRNVVKMMLNIYFVDPLYMGILMCDLYSQLILVWIFSFEINHSLILGEERIGGTSLGLLCLGIGWRILREFAHILSTPLRMYVSDVWNWLDVILISCVVGSISSLSEARPTSNSEGIVLVGTTGFVWIYLIRVISDLRYEVAVFVVAIQRVVATLAPFFFTAFAFVLSFGNMFYVASALEKKDCEIDKGGELEGWTCSLSNSYFTTATMILSSSWIRFNEPSLATSTLLSMGFAVIAGILLLNILIAEISNVYTFIREQGRIAFWIKRLSFITEISLVLPDSIVGKKALMNSNLIGRRVDMSKVPANVYKREDLNEEEKVFFYWWQQNKAILSSPPFVSRLRVFFRRADISQIVLPSRELERAVSGQRNISFQSRFFIFILFPIIPIILIAWTLLGFVTFGLCWQTWMKTYFFFGPNESDTLLHDDVKDTKERIKKMESKVEAMHATLLKMENLSQE